MSLKAFRGSFLDFIDDPFYVPEFESDRYLADGLLVIENGKIKAFGTYESVYPKYPGIDLTSYAPNLLIMPGFIDLHLHFPQTEIIASYGEQLLEWLNKYTFPAEEKFQDADYASQMAAFFLDELLKNGTTTALVFATVHPQSVNSFFAEAQKRNLRMIAGKVMMDRNAPDFLQDTAASSYEQTQQLIAKWHKKDRLLYAVTPRFAVTSTKEQLHLAGKLLAEFPDVYLHTHLSENIEEVELVKQLFPDSENYLDVYDRAGLVGERSIFAHGVQLTDAEFIRLSQTKASIAFCPTSNLFLGSGLFNLHKAKSVATPIQVGLGSDVGGGTSFSLLQTANEAYKVVQLQGQSLSSSKALFLATLGGARALCLENKIGNFQVGKEADFVVLDLNATPLMALRTQNTTDIRDRAFALMMLGSDRAVHATYILGNLAYSNSANDNS